MIISKTPLRISLFGGGTDFPQYYEQHGGAVLSTAINKYVYVIVKKRFDDNILLHYSQTELWDEVRHINHDYIREALKLSEIKGGIEITTMADIPSEGTGLGSSSSLAVGLFNALLNYKSRSNYNERLLADLACVLEIDKLKKGIGHQDQYIAAYGGFRYIGFDSDGVHILPDHEEKLVNRFSQQKETIQKLEDRLLLFYTGITRQASDILSQQVKHIKDNQLTLKEMTISVEVAQMCLEKGDVASIGSLLHTNWERKKKLEPTITNPEIDAMYDRAFEAGAWGGKICGAGGGGFMLLYVEPQHQESVRKALSNYKELSFKFENNGSQIILNEMGD